MKFNAKKWVNLDLENKDHEALVGTEDTYTDAMLLENKESKEYLEACFDMFCDIFSLNKEEVTIDKINNIFKNSSFGLDPFVTKNNTQETTKETMMRDVADFVNNFKEAIKLDSTKRFLYTKDNGEYDSLEQMYSSLSDKEYKQNKEFYLDFNKTHSINSNISFKNDIVNDINNAKKRKEIIYNLLKKTSDPNTSIKERIEIERRIVAYNDLGKVNSNKCFEKIALLFYDGNDNPREWSEQKQKQIGNIISNSLRKKGRILGKNRVQTSINTIRMFMIKNGATLEEAFSDDPKYDEKWKEAANEFLKAQKNGDEAALINAVIACNEEVKKIKIPGKESTIEEKMNFFSQNIMLGAFLKDIVQSTGESFPAYNKAYNDLSDANKRKYNNTMEMANIFGNISLFYKMPELIKSDTSLTLNENFESSNTLAPTLYYIKKYDSFFTSNTLDDYDNEKVAEISNFSNITCKDNQYDDNLAKDIMNKFYDSYDVLNKLDVKKEIKKLKEEYMNDEEYSKRMEEEQVYFKDDDLIINQDNEYSIELNNHKEIEIAKPEFEGFKKGNVAEIEKNINNGIVKGAGFEIINDNESIVEDIQERDRRNESQEILTEKDIVSLELKERFPAGKMIDKKTFEKTIKTMIKDFLPFEGQHEIIPDDSYEAFKKIESIIAKSATYLAQQGRLVPSKGETTYREFFNLARADERVAGKIKSDYLEFAMSKTDEDMFVEKANNINSALMRTFNPKEFLRKEREIEDSERIENLKKSLSKEDLEVLESGKGKLSDEGKKLIELPEEEIEARQEEDEKISKTSEASKEDIIRGVLLVKDLERLHATRSIWTRIGQWFSGNAENKAIENIKKTLYNSHIGKKGIDAALKCDKEYDIRKSVEDSVDDYFRSKGALADDNKRNELWANCEKGLEVDAPDDLQEMANKNLQDYFAPYDKYYEDFNNAKDKIKNVYNFKANVNLDDIKELLNLDENDFIEKENNNSKKEAKKVVLNNNINLEDEVEEKNKDSKNENQKEVMIIKLDPVDEYGYDEDDEIEENEEKENQKEDSVDDSFMSML